MPEQRALKIGIACYPSVGGSGVLASVLGEELARRGHEVHFISYERPFHLPADTPRIHFHRVHVNDYSLFRYPDYTIPLSVAMANVSRDHNLDILHVHYAVPHATAAILAQSMLPPHSRPRVVTTVHGTDIMFLGSDPNYAPAIQHALRQSDAVTAVSAFLERETRQRFDLDKPIDIIHNFTSPYQPKRTRSDVRHELGIRDDQTLILHSSNLRPVKRIGLILEAAARIRPRDSFKLLILAGDDFTPFQAEVRRLDLNDRIIVREKPGHVEDYLQAADLGLFASETESFCLSILELMTFGCPSVATRVGGIPELVDDTRTGLLTPSDDPAALARAVETLIADPAARIAMGQAAKKSATERFSADVIVPRYEALYHRVCEVGPASS